MRARKNKISRPQQSHAGERENITKSILSSSAIYASWCLHTPRTRDFFCVLPYLQNNASYCRKLSTNN